MRSKLLQNRLKTAFLSAEKRPTAIYMFLIPGILRHVRPERRRARQGEGGYRGYRLSAADAELRTSLSLSDKYALGEGNCRQMGAGAVGPGAQRARPPRFETGLVGDCNHSAAYGLGQPSLAASRCGHADTPDGFARADRMWRYWNTSDHGGDRGTLGASARDETQVRSCIDNPLATAVIFGASGSLGF